MKKKLADTIKEIIQMVDTDKDAQQEFNKRLITENIRRFIYLLGIVIFSQIVFMILEIVGVVNWYTAIFFMRILIIFLCLAFILTIHLIQKNTFKKKFTYLEIILTIMQILTILIGCYFVIFMFNSGIYSFSTLLLVSFVASLTCVKNPYYAGLVFIIVFAAMSIFINVSILSFSLWYGEFFIGLVFMILLYIGNIMNYNRHLKLFLQEKEIKDMNEQFKIMSQTDDLTGIYNRRKITEVIDDYIGLSQKHHKSFCIALIDIDHFKNINDDFGHSTGDKVLYYFSSNIKFLMHSTHVLSRWGGDEFIVVMPNCNDQEGSKVIEDIRIGIERYRFPDVGQVTFSAGISSYEEGDDISKLIDKADIALYASKKKGRNQINVYNSEMKKEDRFFSNI